MKTIKTIILSLSLLPTLALASFDTNLHVGSKGDSVKELQQFLTSQGVFTSQITGNFFSVTMKAVKDFQKKEGINQTGFWGQLSRAKAIDISNRVQIVPQLPIINSIVQSPIVVAPIQPQIVYVPVYQPLLANPLPIVNTPVVAPTCTIALDPSSLDTNNNNDVVIDWTSTNAISGNLQVADGGPDTWSILWDLSKDVVLNGVPRGNTLAKGYTTNIHGPNFIQVVFTGSGGTTSCEIPE